MSPGQRGFTLFELLSVMAAISILTALSLPAMVRSIHQGRVNDAAMQIVSAVNEAHQQALQRRRLTDQLVTVATAEPVPYGITIRPRAGSEAAHVVLVGWKPGATTPAELGKRRYFNDNVDVFAAGTGVRGVVPTTPAPADFNLYFAFGSGFPGLTWSNPGGVTTLGAAEAAHIVVGTRDLTYDVTGPRWSAGLGATVRVYPFVGTVDAQPGQTP